jgi:hypothetical protein
MSNVVGKPNTLIQAFLSLFAGQYKNTQDAYEQVLHIGVVIHDDGSLPNHRQVPAHASPTPALAIGISTYVYIWQGTPSKHPDLDIKACYEPDLLSQKRFTNDLGSSDGIHAKPSSSICAPQQ